MPSIMGLTTTKETQRPKSSSDQRRGAQQNINLHHVHLENGAIPVQTDAELTTAVEIVRASSNRRRGATIHTLHHAHLENGAIPAQTDGEITTAVEIVRPNQYPGDTLDAERNCGLRGIGTQEGVRGCQAPHPVTPHSRGRGGRSKLLARVSSSSRTEMRSGET